MVEESRPGVWETVLLREDGLIELERMVVFEDENQAHGEEIVEPGTAKFDEVISRHPNLKVGVPHQIELPRTGKGQAKFDPNNEIKIHVE